MYDAWKQAFRTFYYHAISQNLSWEITRDYQVIPFRLRCRSNTLFRVVCRHFFDKKQGCFQFCPEKLRNWSMVWSNTHKREMDTPSWNLELILNLIFVNKTVEPILNLALDFFRHLFTNRRYNLAIINVSILQLIVAYCPLFSCGQAV